MSDEPGAGPEGGAGRPAGGGPAGGGPAGGTPDGTAEGAAHRGAGAAASKGVLGRGSIYTIGTAAPILANAAVLPLVTRQLSGPDYGVVAVAIVVIQVAMMTASFGMPSVITRQGILAKSGVAGARALLIRGSLMTTALLGAIILASPLWEPLVKETLRSAVLMALAASAFFVVVESSQALLRVLDRPGAFVALSLTATLGGPLLGLALLAGDRTPGRYLVGLIVGYAAAAAVGLLLCLRGGRPARDHGDTRAALRLGLPVIPHLVALFLANGALVFLASSLYDLATAGRIQLALLVGSSPAVVISALNNSWAPIVYRADERQRATVIAHTARDITTLAALISGGVALLSPWLMRLVAGAKLAPLELVPAVAIVAFGCVLSVVYLANVHLVFAAGRSLGLSLITPLSLVFGLGCAYLAGRESLVVLAVGFPATYLALAVGTAWLRRHVGAVAWSELALLGPVGLGLMLCTLGLALPSSGTASVVRVAVAALAGFGTLLLARRALK